MFDSISAKDLLFCDEMTLDELNGLMVLLACRGTGMLSWALFFGGHFMDMCCKLLYDSVWILN